MLQMQLEFVDCRYGMLQMFEIDKFLCRTHCNPNDACYIKDLAALHSVNSSPAIQ